MPPAEGGSGENWTVPLGLQMAATSLAVLPFVILFLWLQTQTEGIATSGLKQGVWRPSPRQRRQPSPK